jgi:hypothetical protein
MSQNRSFSNPLSNTNNLQNISSIPQTPNQERITQTPRYILPTHTSPITPQNFSMMLEPIENFPEIQYSLLNGYKFAMFAGILFSVSAWTAMLALREDLVGRWTGFLEITEDQVLIVLVKVSLGLLVVNLY